METIPACLWDAGSLEQGCRDQISSASVPLTALPTIVFDSQEQSHKPLVSAPIPSVHRLWESPASLPSYFILSVWEEPGWGKIWAGCLGLFMDHIGCTCLLVTISGHLAADLVEQECYLGSWAWRSEEISRRIRVSGGILYPSFCFGLGAIAVMQGHLLLWLLLAFLHH